MEKVSKTLEDYRERVSQLVSRINSIDDYPRTIDIDLLLATLRDMYDAVYALKVKEPDVISTSQAEQATAPDAANSNSNQLADVILMIDEEQPATFAPAEESSEDNKVADALISDENLQENEEMFQTEDTEISEKESAHLEQDSDQVIDEESFIDIDDSSNNTVEDSDENSPQSIEQPASPEPPQTLWDKLQAQQPSTTIGEQVQTRTLFDQLSDEPLAIDKLREANASLNPVNVENAPQSDIPEEEHPQQSLSLETNTTTEQSTPIVEPAAKPTEKQSSLFDYLSTAAPSSARIAEQGKETLAETLGRNRSQLGIEKTMASNKVKDLRTIININDKFSFQNELFHYNMRAYNEFIVKLNAIDSREEAMAYVSSVAQQNDWNNESLTVKTFFKLFDQKF